MNTTDPTPYNHKEKHKLATHSASHDPISKDSPLLGTISNLREMVAQPKDKNDEELLNGIGVRGGIQGYVRLHRLNLAKPFDIIKARNLILEFRECCPEEGKRSQTEFGHYVASEGKPRKAMVGRIGT